MVQAHTTFVDAKLLCVGLGTGHNWAVYDHSNKQTKKKETNINYKKAPLLLSSTRKFWILNLCSIIQSRLYGFAQT